MCSVMLCPAICFHWAQMWVNPGTSGSRTRRGRGSEQSGPQIFLGHSARFSCLFFRSCPGGV